MESTVNIVIVNCDKRMPKNIANYNNKCIPIRDITIYYIPICFNIK